MDAWEGLLAGSSGDFPRGPADGGKRPARLWLVAFLFMMCFVPRAVAAWRWDILWGDSLRYRFASICLEQGDFEQGFAEFGLNIYPIILIPLRHLGIDWQITAKYFGVLVASLTVLPLWGWLRRMFDDRLAAIACLVYALHGKLIAISPLIMRDSTFWFLLVLTLYYLWRAIGELRIGLFLAAGLALTLAVHTRTEGWLLLIPLLGWSACRVATAQGKRLRLAAGIVLTLAMIPAAVTIVNFTWLRANPRWEFLRMAHIELAVDWWNEASGMNVRVPSPEPLTSTQRYGLLAKNSAVAPTKDSANRPPTAPHHEVQPNLANDKPRKSVVAAPLPQITSILVPEAVPPELTTPSWKLTFKLLELLAKSCTWVGGFLLLAGLICGWRVFFRPEHLTLFVLNMFLFVLMRVRYGIAGIDQRYFMPIVILGVPWMAMGLERVIAGALWLARRRGEISTRAARIVAGGLIAVAVALSLLDGPISIPAYMRTHRDVGLWILGRVGPDAILVGNVDDMALETFYAQGHVAAIVWPRDCMIVPMPKALTERKGDVIVLWNDDGNIPDEYLPKIAERITRYCGYRRIDPKELPVGENEVMVFVRE